MDHLCNRHDDCYHDSLDTLEERRKKWFTPGLHYKVLTFFIMQINPLGSKPIEKLDDVITNGRLMSDMRNLVNFISSISWQQTDSLGVGIVWQQPHLHLHACKISHIQSSIGYVPIGIP